VNTTRAALALASLGLVAACNADTTHHSADEDQVIEVCHNRVLGQLKAPATADFGGDSVTGGEPTYTDTGYVDSENSFGAKIRTEYVCTARHTGGVNFSVRATLL